jgi:glycerophosphoryl diester phosphodiesterase
MWKIGHRGACGHAPENTLLSMRKALEFGVHGVEFDIQMSHDGIPVVIHDDTLERTTNGHGRVEDYDLKELQALDAGKGEAIPSLAQIFDLVDKRCRLFIELKAENSTNPVAELIAYYVERQGWSYEQLFVCSFDHGQLLDIKQLNHDIRTCALIAGIPVSLAEIAADAGAWAINPCINHINQSLVDDAHKRGLKVLTWTANTPHDINKARSLAVDGIVSNFPDTI